MKIFISGKITGDPKYIEKFQKVAEELRNEGHIPINPAAMSDATPGLDHEDYMQICFRLIDVADGVLFLDDYIDSPGALAESAYCRNTNKQTFSFCEFPWED